MILNFLLIFLIVQILFLLLDYTHSIEGLDADSKVIASDLTLPEKTTLAADPETVLATITHEVVAAEPETEATEEGADEAAAESE